MPLEESRGKGGTKGLKPVQSSYLPYKMHIVIYKPTSYIQDNKLHTYTTTKIIKVNYHKNCVICIKKNLIYNRQNIIGYTIPQKHRVNKTGKTN